MYVLAFDRDWTVDLNPHPRRKAVPIEWVEYWAHETTHEVWAIGNQDLVEEANIPGTVESVRRRDGDIQALGDLDESGHYDWWPDREERLHILEELFPAAESYIVVDDLDLSHVDGWDHYHAWDFVEAVENGELALDVPSESADLEPDGGYSVNEVKSIASEAQLFKLRRRVGDSTPLDLVRYAGYSRPAAQPFTGHGFFFEKASADEELSVRLDNIAEFVPLNWETIPMEYEYIEYQAAATLTANDPASADPATIKSMMEKAPTISKSGVNPTSLNLSAVTLDHLPQVGLDIVDHIFQLLEEVESPRGRSVFEKVAGIAEESPEICDSHVDTLSQFVTNSSYYESEATKCLMVIAEEEPALVLDAIPALETAVTDGQETAQSNAVYTLSTIASEFPSQVYPTRAALIDVLEGETESIQTNAVATLGKIASKYPDGADSIVQDVVPLLDADSKRARNNAVGLLADLGETYPEHVIEYTEEIAERLNDRHIQTRINASIALLNGGGANPGAIRNVQGKIIDALDDASPEVRANACTLVGNAEIEVDEDRLRKLSKNDLNDRVREQASWARSQLRGS